MTVYDPPTTAFRGIAVAALVADATLELAVKVVAGEAGLERTIQHPRIQKTGLVLVGHTHGLVPGRVQVLGETELSFLATLDRPAQARAAHYLFEKHPACVMVTRGVEVPEPIRIGADQTSTPLLVCLEKTSQAITALHAFLDERLAPRTRVHGVLVDVFEVGVLLLGKSGIGKSECALELVMKGHRLVADDVVECDFRPPGTVYGEPAPLLRHHIEVRGLGILDIKELFGVTAVRDRKQLDLVVRLEEASEDRAFDRIGLEERRFDILGTPIREVMLPVRPGRNMSSIIEIAARDELLRQTGHDASRDFLERVDRTLTGRGLAAAVPPSSAQRVVTALRRQSEPAGGAFESSGLPPAEPEEER